MTLSVRPNLGALTALACSFNGNSKISNVANSAGTSPTVWTRGLASLGLAGTHGLASPIEDLLSFKTNPSLSRSDD